MGILISHSLPAPQSTEFDRWWHSQGVWVEPANKRRGGESGVLLLQARDPKRPQLYCKRQAGHTYRTLLHPLGQPTVLREIKAYRAFAHLGIRVPKLVYGAARMHAGQWQALLVTEALSGFISLEQWYGTHTPDQSLRGLVMNQVASMLASLHRAGWQHGCCYPKHIFVKIAPRNTEPPVVETAILDLEKSRRRLRSKDAARHDLSQLWRHRGPIPEPDCIHLLQEHGRLLAKSCHEAGSAK